MTIRRDNHDLAGERILNEAGALFAQEGFEAVGVREITCAANCNLAAANCH